MRQEHRSDLARLLDETGLDNAALCSTVRSARAEGQKLGRVPRRVADVGALLNLAAIKKRRREEAEDAEWQDRRANRATAEAAKGIIKQAGFHLRNAGDNQ